MSTTLRISPGPALLIGSRNATRTSLLDAACINGTAAHALDYDDMGSGGHPSAPVVPVLLALGDELRSTGLELIDAYLAGFEAQSRLYAVLLPHHYNAGWHPTATIGTFGAAVAASRLLKLDARQTATAIAVSASLASGLKANFGTMTKAFHVGHCARNGLLAALLAMDDFDANMSALEHRQGFSQVFDGIDNLDLNRLIEDRPRGPSISREQYGIKQFPCCGSTHSAIVAALALRKQLPDNLDVERIKAIDIHMHPDRLGHTNNPNPLSPLAAKFSVQYSVARALLSNAVLLPHFEEEAVQDPRIRKLLQVTTTISSTTSGGSPAGGPWEATVRAVLDDGIVVQGHNAAYVNRGSVNPMSGAELFSKFADCSWGVLRPEAAQRAFDLLWKLPELESATVRELLDSLSYEEVPISSVL